MDKVWKNLIVKFQHNLNYSNLLKRKSYKSRNKKSEIENLQNLQHVELKLEKLQESKYSTQDVLLKEGEMGNLEEWSSVVEEKMAHFDDVVDRLKSAISNVKKKEETKAKHEENTIQDKMFRRRMQEKLKIEKMKL